MSSIKLIIGLPLKLLQLITCGNLAKHLPVIYILHEITQKLLACTDLTSLFHTEKYTD